MKEKAPGAAPVSESDLVVVLLATFEGSPYLGEQLESIAGQSHTRWRLLVADDGSRDNTLEIVRKFSERHPNQVRIVAEGPVGSPRDNFFRLLRMAPPAPYVAFCDQDDVWAPDKLEILVRQCQRLETLHPDEPCLVYSDLQVVDANLGILNPSFLNQIGASPGEISYKTLLAENAIPGCAMLFNASLANVYVATKSDPVDAIMHDWWMALLASAVGHVSYVPAPLVNYRQHAANTLGTVERSGLLFALSKLFRGDRSAGLRTYVQAAAFVGAYGDLLAPTIGEDIRTFASLADVNKIERIRLLLTHQTLKQTPLRRVYQLLRA